jgi:hypothetical protein
MARSGDTESSRDAVRAEQQSSPAVSGTLLICHRKQCCFSRNDVARVTDHRVGI